MVREANAFITRNRSRPFFVYWAINMPHYPLQGAAKWRKVYEHLDSPRNMYAAFISTIDEAIGQVLGHLDTLGLRDNTLIIFQSDHGHSTEERTFFAGGNPGPYRGAKGCLFEGGVRVPSIVCLPGVIPQNQTRDQMVTGCDWLPTIADFCGVKLPDRHLDGKSIRPIILSPDAKSPHESFYWHLGSGKNVQWVVREGDWKLLGNPRDRSEKAPLTQDDKLFLVNLARDHTEMRNLAKDYPQIVDRLSARRDQYIADIDRAK